MLFSNHQMANGSDLKKTYLTNIDEFMRANDASEMYFNHDGSVSYLSNCNMLFTGAGILPSEHLIEFIWQLAWDCHVRIDPFRPFAGGIIAGAGLRWHAVIPPASPDGPVLAIRRQSLDSLEIESFFFENVSVDDVLMWQKNHVSTVFFGATGSGKTSLLHAILKRGYATRRVGIIESVVELPISSKFWFRLAQVGEDLGGRGSVTLESLIAETLRLSPQVLVLGEIRTHEARAWRELSKTGHGGVMTTMHAGNADQARDRLKNLIGIAGELMPDIMGLHVFRGEKGKVHCRAVNLN